MWCFRKCKSFGEVEAKQRRRGQQTIGAEIKQNISGHDREEKNTRNTRNIEEKRTTLLKLRTDLELKAEVPGSCHYAVLSTLWTFRTWLDSAEAWSEVRYHWNWCLWNDSSRWTSLAWSNQRCVQFTEKYSILSLTDHIEAGYIIN